MLSMGRGGTVMKRLGLFLVLLGIVAVAAIAIPATAAEHDHEHLFDPHPHLLVQRPEIDIIMIDGEPVPHLVGIRKCVDLAGNNAVPLDAHHEQVHFGDTGVSFDGASGHVVVPAAPFPAPLFEPVPWSNCEEFEAMIPFPVE